MAVVTTHVLDTSIGKPAEGVRCNLSVLEGSEWKYLSDGITNFDGRADNLLASFPEIQIGTFKLQFQTKAYFEETHGNVFYPWIDVVFTITSEGSKQHIPILLSPYGYSTYRGS